MKKNNLPVYTYRIELYNRVCGTSHTFLPDEDYGDIFEVWNELLLRFFHPSEQPCLLLYAFNIRLLIWRTGHKAMVLAKDMDLEYYYEHAETKENLGVDRETLRKLHELKIKYILKYNEPLFIRSNTRLFGLRLPSNSYERGYILP